MNIDFYLEFLRFNEENDIKREKHFKNLTERSLKSYCTNLSPNIEFNNDENTLGSFDSYENNLKVFNADFLTKELTNNDMYEIIETVLHEPFHVKQYEDYLKDNASYPGFKAALPMGFGYFLQREETEAFEKRLKTFKTL